MSDLDADAIGKAIAGLMYPSESDAPFEFFRWSASAGENVLAAVTRHGSAAAGLATAGVGEFFDPLADSDDAERFAQLRAVMQARVSGLSVVRAGRVEVSIYLIGRAGNGDWIGVRTVSVET